MKPRILFMISLLVVTMLSAATIDPRLAEYLSLAERNNLEMQMARKSLEASSARRLQSVSGLLPDLTLSSSLTRFDEAKSIALSDSFAIPMQPKQTTTTKFELTQVLFSPAVFYNHLTQRAVYKTDEYACQTRLEDLRLEVVEGYYGYLQSAELVAMKQSSLDLARENLKLTQDLFNVEKVPRTDLLRAQVGWMSGEQELRDAKSRETLAANNFNRLLGREMGTPVGHDPLSLKDLADLDIHAALPMPDSVDQAVARAMSNRPEIRQIDAGLRSLKLARRAVVSGYLPSLVAVGDYGWSRDNFRYTPDDDYWTITGVLQWNLFSGFGTTGRVREVRAQLRQYELSSENTRRLIELDVRNARIAYLHDLDGFEVARSTYLTAEANYSMVQKQYQNDLAPMITLMDAKNLLDSSKANLVVSYFNALVSGIKYRKSIGLPVWQQNGEDNE